MAWSKRRAVDPWLVAILLGALLLRLGYPALVGLPERTPLHGFVIDEQEYFGAAAVLAAGRGLHFYDTFLWTRTPLYPLLVGGLFRLFGPDTSPVFALQAVLSTITLVSLAALAARCAARAPALGLSPRAAARLAALLGALWLPFTLFANLLLSETLFLLLVVVAFGLLLRWADGRQGSGVRGQGSGVRGQSAVGGRQSPVVNGPSVDNPQSAIRNPQYGSLFAAGLLLGLAALTRSTALAFVPLVGGWVLWWAGRRGAGRALAALLIGLALPVGAGVAYNYSAYHALIIGDTSSGYNLWLASTGVRDAERLNSDLRTIADPVEKSRYATGKALENIAAAPSDFLLKGVKESLDFWRINFGAEERQVRGYSWGRVPAAHLLSLLVGEDGLYITIVLLALVGLAAAPPDPLKALTALWTLTWLAVVFVFFAVTRFRLPVVALLLPWTPLGLAYLRNRLRRVDLSYISRKTHWIAGGLAAAFLVVVLSTLPDAVRAVGLGVGKWVAQAPYRAALLLLGPGGDPAASLAQLAQADQTVPDTLWAQDALRLAQGGTDLTALAARPEIVLGRDSPLADQYAPFLLNGAILRAQGQSAAAHTAFTARSVQLAGSTAVDWAAQFVPAPSGARLAVGSGLDLGALRGFYANEAAGSGAAAVTYRWSGPTATVRLPVTAATRQVVIRWSGARPTGVPPAVVQVQLQADSLPAQPATGTYTLPTTDTWQEASLPVQPTASGWVTLTLQANGFVPGGYDPRLLGVRVAWVAAR